MSVSEIASRLWDVTQLDHCVVWIGSGLSAPAGYPDWRKTVANLCAACEVDPLSDSSSPGDSFLAKADECKNSNLDAYYELLRETFGHDRPVVPLSYMRLADLPFRAFITTNFDPLLDIAINHSAKKGVLLQYPILPVKHLSGADRIIYYAHGRARNGDGPCGKNLVFSKSEFDAAYHGAGQTSSLLSQILTYNHIVFLGCSLSEPPLEKLLGLVNDVQASIGDSEKRWQRPRKIMVLPPKFKERMDESGAKIVGRDEDDERKEDIYFGDFSIEVLRYGSALPDDHSPLQRVLEMLCELAQQPNHLEAQIDLGKGLPTT